MEWLIRSGSLEAIDSYNCSAYKLDSSEWKKLGRVDVPLGLTCLVYGIIIEIIYIPCLTVIVRPEYLKLSCYKIMAFLGIFDMLAIAVNSILTGYLLISGAVFCTHPYLIYIAGCIGLGLWCGSCFTCFILVLNRLIDLWKPHLMVFAFKGFRTYIVLLIPLAYAIYFTFFTGPLIFNSSRKAWFFDPFIWEGKALLDGLLPLSNEHGKEIYVNIPHTINNLLIVVITCLLYGFLCIILTNKYDKEMTSSAAMTWAQRSIFIQSTLICMANLVAALVYVYMQFFSAPDLLVLIGHMCWQGGHGIPAIVYLVVNRTIQTEVLKMFGLAKYRATTRAHTHTNGPLYTLPKLIIAPPI